MTKADLATHVGPLVDHRHGVIGNPDDKPHVAARTAGPIAESCTEVSRLVGPAVKPRILDGVVRR
jgi:hypothetical protein